VGLDIFGAGRIFNNINRNIVLNSLEKTKLLEIVTGCNFPSEGD